MLAAKIDLLMKKLEEQAKTKKQWRAPSRPWNHTWRVRSVETLAIWGIIASKSVKKLPTSTGKHLVLGQVKINENITKKLMYNDKMLENINSKIESLSSSVKNQLSFNKMIETQISQLATAIPIDRLGKTSGQPENSLENVNAAVDQWRRRGLVRWTKNIEPLPKVNQ